MSKQFSAVLKIGGAIAASLPSAFGTVNRGTAAISRTLSEMTTKQRELNKELNAMSRVGPPSPARYLAAKRELDVMNAQVEAMRKRKKLADQIVASREARIDSAGRLGGAVLGAGVVAAPVGAAIKGTAEFDYRMQSMGNRANLTAKEIHALRTEIIAASKAAGQSAGSMQQGYDYLSGAGMSAAGSKALLPTIGKVATGQAADVEDVSKTAFSLADTLNVATADMEAVFDSLVVTDKMGSVQLKEIAKQVPVLSSGFKALRMEGREAAASMAAGLQIARKGAADADEAANNMKNYIAKVMSPDTLKKAKKEFGLDLYKVIQDAQTKGGNPFEASLEAIIKATAGDQKKIGELFGDMQVQNFIRPMAQNWDDYKKIKDAAMSANGEVGRDFDKMRATSLQRMNEMSNAVDRLSIAIGSLFAGKAGDGSKGLADQIESLSAWIEANRELVITGAKVSAVLIGVGIAARAVAFAWNTAASVWALAQAGFAAAPAVLGAMGKGLAVVGRGVLFVGRALMLNPIGLAVTAIAGAAYLVYKNWEPLKQFFGDLWDSITAKFDAAVNYMSKKIDYVKSLPGRLYDGVFGGSSPAAAPAAPVPVPLPAPAMASRGATSYNVTIHQAPGQSPAATAAAVAQRLGAPRAMGAQLHD